MTKMTLLLVAFALLRAISFRGIGSGKEVCCTNTESILQVPNDARGCYNYQAYLLYARTYADTLIQAAIDKYGRFPTPMFLQMLTLDTHKPVTKNDAPDWQNRYGAEDFMRGAMGSNLYRDIHNIEALYELTEVTGEQKYRDAADAYMGSFLTHNVSPYTGLFAWGEHMYWDVFLDTVVAQREEFEIPLPPWELLWRIDSIKVKSDIDGIYKYHVYDKKTFWYDRHANWYTGQFDEPAVRGTYIKHSGLYAYSFAFMYVKTHNPKYLSWLHGIAGVFWKLRDKKTGLVGSSAQGGNTADQMQLLSYYLVKAYQLCRQQFLLDYAVSYMRAFAKYTYDPATGKFFYGVYVATGTPAKDGYQPVWGGYGEASFTGHTLALLYEVTKDHYFLNYAEKVGSYIERTPIGSDATPEEFGRVIRLFLDLYRLTGRGRYLIEARSYANVALSKLFVNGLFKESVAGYVYNADSDPGLLALQLLKLYQTERKVPVHWMAPLLWLNPSEPVIVNAKFTGDFPRKAEMNYDFSDGSSGKVHGKKSKDTYSFRIAVPHPNYEGVLAFSLEWETRSGEHENSKDLIGEGIVKINRDAYGPLFTNWLYPEINPNNEFTPVKVRIIDPFGIKQVALHYKFSDGREGTLGYANPVVSGDEVGWEIPPPGKCFWGETQFHVVAWGNPDAPVEKVSDTKIVKESVVSVQSLSVVASEEKHLWFSDEDIGITIKSNRQISNASLRVERLPVNPVKSVVGLPKKPDSTFASETYYLIKASPDLSSSLQTMSITLPYNIDQKEKLLVSSISIYSWNGQSWEVVPSKIDEENNTVTAEVNRFGIFAVDGKSRLLWRRAFNGAMQVQPVVADLFGNGKLEIITNSGESDHRIYALDSSGNIIWSFSLTSASGFGFPVVADVDGDGKPEIIAGGNDGTLYVLNNEGKLKWKFVSPKGELLVRGGVVGMSVAVGDLFGNGKLEVVAASGNGYIYVFNGAGRLLWEKDAGSARSIPCIADLFGDGKREIISGSASEDNVCVFDNKGDLLWSVKTNGYISYGIAVGDMNKDGQKEILFNARRNQVGEVWCLSADGKPLWTYPCDGNGDWSVVLADMQGDGKLEAIINNVNQEELTLLNFRGERVRGIPIKSRSTITPAVLDLNGDGRLDLIISGNDDRCVHAIDNCGKEMWSFQPPSPVFGGTKVKGGGTPVIADINGTGELDVIFGDDESWFYAIRAGTICKPWGIAINNYNGNIEHTGVYYRSMDLGKKPGIY